MLGIRVTGRGPEVRMTLDVRPMYRPSPPADAGLTLEPIADPAATPIYPG
ncbi:hypothetical protein [Nocardiopsis gilva]|nr:hypothetical protein [Nocardiopsis gilva]